MPILTYTTSSTPFAGLLNSRVLIGRRLSHGVILSDPSVSRLHAWIDPIADESAEWVITDAGSKTGTYVNDQKISRHPLHHGDVIRVGSVSLLYQDQETLPAGTHAVELSSPSGVVKTSGILFECACGAPLWVGNDLAGKRGVCRHCRQPVTVPELKPPTAVDDSAPVSPPVSKRVATAPPAPKLPVQPADQTDGTRKLARCAVCHSDIQPDEERTQCPDCAMHFHAECWQENLGCSSYGCPQVNVLQPAGAEQIKVVQDAGEPPRHTPWEPILLGASVVGSFLGTIAFGSFAAVVAIAAAVVLIQGKAARASLLILAIAISLIGVAAGLGVSDFLYFNARHWPEPLRHHVP